MKPKICPYMSCVDTELNNKPVFVECQENQCQLWIEVFTTELHITVGCTHELAPQMVDGLFRV